MAQQSLPALEAATLPKASRMASRSCDGFLSEAKDAAKVTPAAQMEGERSRTCMPAGLACAAGNDSLRDTSEAWLLKHRRTSEGEGTRSRSGHFDNTALVGTSEGRLRGLGASS